MTKLLAISIPFLALVAGAFFAPAPVLGLVCAGLLLFLLLSSLVLMHRRQRLAPAARWTLTAWQVPMFVLLAVRFGVLLSRL